MRVRIIAAEEAGRPCRRVVGCGVGRRRGSAALLQRLLLLFLIGLGGLGGVVGIFLQILVDDLDLRGGADLLHRVRHLLAQQHVADRRLHLVEGLGHALLAVFETDDVPAEIGLHRLRGLAHLEREGRLGELGHHFRRGEIAEVAAVVLRAVEAVLLGQVFELLALGEAGQDVLGLLLGADQDVAGAHALGLLQLGSFLVIDRLHFLFRHLRADLLEEIGVAQRLGLVEGQAALVFLGIGDAFLDRELGQQMALDQIFDHEGEAQLGRQIGQLADDVVGRHLDFGNPDLVAVDDGHDLVLLGRVLRRGGKRQRQPQKGGRHGRNSANYERTTSNPPFQSPFDRPAPHRRCSLTSKEGKNKPLAHRAEGRKSSAHIGPVATLLQGERPRLKALLRGSNTLKSRDLGPISRPGRRFN